MGSAGQRALAASPTARYAAPENPDGFFDTIDEEATAYHLAIRDGQLEGVSPNDGTTGWADFVDRVAWANQTAREIVATGLIFLPCKDDDCEDGEP